MKNIIKVLILLFIFGGCKEEPVEYELMTNVQSERKVVIEEFTGVNCVNCPLGSIEIENLQSTFGDNLIPISIHSGFFATPHPDNLYDFRTDDGNAITTFVGEPNAWPSAVIDRVIFDGSQERQTSKENWAGYISSELAVVPKIKVENSVTYDMASRNMSLNVDLTKLHVDLPSSLKITVLITESHIIDRQLTPAPVGVVTDYDHKHVLRDVLTNATGDLITQALVIDTPTTLNYTYTLPQEWVPENCEVVVFVAKPTSSDQTILQADADPLVQ